VTRKKSERHKRSRGGKLVTGGKNVVAKKEGPKDERPQGMVYNDVAKSALF
jgi:hypothetical protein